MLPPSLSRLAVITVLTLSTSSYAASQRTFVASNGIDANPCSINLPCRSFGAAIGQTVASGEIVVQDSAGYGTVTIGKSISIIAPTGIYAGISVFAGQTGITVDGAGIVVVLRGLSINGVGGTNGIHLAQGSRLRVESCVVSDLSSSGIIHDAAGAELIVIDTVVRDNGGVGINLNADATMLLDGVRVEHNAGDGVSARALTSLADVTIRDSVLSYNGQAGFATFIPNFGAVTKFLVESSTLSHNGGDGIFAASAIGQGRISGVVRRSAIAWNTLSGISAFDGASGGAATVLTADNSFSGNGSNAIKVDGQLSEVFSSGNLFTWGEAAFWTGSGGSVQLTYGDNLGASLVVGASPTPILKH